MSVFNDSQDPCGAHLGCDHEHEAFRRSTDPTGYLFEHTPVSWKIIGISFIIFIASAMIILLVTTK